MSKSIQCLCVVFVLILPTIIPAQIWVARYNGPGDSIDLAHAIAVDGAGNVYVTGGSYGATSQWDYATLKYDSLGVEQWVARYSGEGSNLDIAYALAVDGAGYIYVTGRSYVSTTSYDYATIKYDSFGTEQWVVRYDGSSNGDDCANAIVLGIGSGVLVTGRSYGPGACYGYATVKYDSLGDEQWVARYNGPGSVQDEAYGIAVDSVGSAYVTGRSYGLGTGHDYATVKYDSLGDEQWVARYNGPGNADDLASAIAMDIAGNIYVTGESYGSGTGEDYVTVKYDASGVEKWVVRYDGPINGYDKAYAIAVDSACNIYVTGHSYGVGTWGDVATVKYDSAGAEQWVARYDGPGNDEDCAYAIVVDGDCNVYVTGPSYGSGSGYDYVTVMYDSSGVEKWVIRYNGPGNGNDASNAIAIDNADYIYITGSSVGSGTFADYATIKYAPTGIAENKLTVKKENEITATIIRGPLRLPEGKKCKVFDITGRVVEPFKIQPGIYFIEVDGVITQKVVKVR